MQPYEYNAVSNYELKSNIFPINSTDAKNLFPLIQDSSFGLLHSNVPNAINYRLGITKDYEMALHHRIEQQYDLRPNHYFLVALNNLPFIRPTNQLLVADGDPDPTSGQQRSYEREILARCVVSAPFVFDRGQSHSVVLSQPTNVSRLHIELLDEGGIHRFETNRQEISFTFSFVRRVRP